MKNDLSFKILAAAVFAGLFLSLVDASSSPGTPLSGAHPEVTPAAASGPIALAQR